MSEPPLSPLVHATISADAAADREWDAIVVGAGPAGAATAVWLARGGRRVLLVERSAMPRAKVCGSCLSPLAVHELDAIGLSVARVGGVRRTQVRLVSGGRYATLSLDGWTLSRDRLDSAIVRRAVDAGAAWLPHANVSRIEETAMGVVVAGVSGRPFVLRAAHAVVAAGLGGRIRIDSPAVKRPPRRRRAPGRIGVGMILPAGAVDTEAGELVMHVARAGYCGVVRLEDGRIDVAAAVEPHWLGAHRSVRAAVASLCGGVVARAIGSAGAGVRCIGTPPLTHESPAVVGRLGRIVRVGDAAAYVEPFTGEGIGWALLGGRLVAESMLEQSADGSAAAAARVAIGYERRASERLRGPRRRCHAVSRAIRHPAVVAAAVAATRLSPRVGARALPWVVGGVMGGVVAAEPAPAEHVA